MAAIMPFHVESSLINLFDCRSKLFVQKNVWRNKENKPTWGNQIQLKETSWEHDLLKKIKIIIIVNDKHNLISKKQKNWWMDECSVQWEALIVTELMKNCCHQDSCPPIRWSCAMFSSECSCHMAIKAPQ